MTKLISNIIGIIFFFFTFMNHPVFNICVMFIQCSEPIIMDRELHELIYGFTYTDPVCPASQVSEEKPGAPT